MEILKKAWMSGPQKKGEKSDKTCVYEKQRKNKENSSGQTYQQLQAENLLSQGAGLRFFLM